MGGVRWCVAADGGGLNTAATAAASGSVAGCDAVGVCGAVCVCVWDPSHTSITHTHITHQHHHLTRSTPSSSAAPSPTPLSLSHIPLTLPGWRAGRPPAAGQRPPALLCERGEMMCEDVCRVRECAGGVVWCGVWCDRPPSAVASPSQALCVCCAPRLAPHSRPVACPRPPPLPPPTHSPCPTHALCLSGCARAASALCSLLCALRAPPAACHPPALCVMW